MSKDYYNILGIDKSASKADIKKAFRAKAKEHHPDKGGDEAKFKEINEAYEVLSDDQKKTQYDQFGSVGGQGFGGGGFDFSGFQGQSGNFDFGGGNFGGFEDIFSSFFGGQAQSNTQQKSSYQRGSDLEVEIELTFEEALKGTTKSIPARRYIRCEKCDAKGGSGQKKCETCNGSGRMTKQFQTPFGTVQQQTTCGTCHGSGKVFEKICNKCHGEGRYEHKEKIEINVPAGLDNNTTLKMRGDGDAGKNGGSNGDLYVHLKVKPSKVFQRQKLDLITELEIPIFEAISGTTKTISTFWDKVDLEIPEKTAHGTRLTIEGQGVKRDGQVGDHIVIIKHLMPKKISKKLQSLLEESQKEGF